VNVMSGINNQCKLSADFLIGSSSGYTTEWEVILRAP
jgi:hypothetical protein